MANFLPASPVTEEYTTSVLSKYNPQSRNRRSEISYSFVVTPIRICQESLEFLHLNLMFPDFSLSLQPETD